MADELRRSEAYLAEAQRLSRTGSFGWNVASGELVWSKETFCILGYDRATQPAMELVLRRVHPDDLALVRQAFDRATREHADIDLEHRLLMPDGTVKHVRVVAHAVTADAGAVEFVGALMDVTEHKKTQDALRASEHLARGQLDALTRTLEALARESDPDRLLEHVLRTIAGQSGAHSVGVWDRNEDDGGLDLRAVIDGGRFRLRGDASHPAERLPALMQRYPAWSEVLGSGHHAVLAEMDRESARLCVGSDADAVRHRVLEDADPDPEVKLLKRTLRALDVRTILFVPMMIAGSVAGIIGIHFTHRRVFRDEEIDLTRALAHQAMLAIQLVRLSRQSRRAAVAAERNRMARDIHDTLAQGFTGIIVQLEAAADANSKGLAPEAEAHLVRARDLARESLQEARRSVQALRPRTLEGRDLCEALRHLVRRLTEGTAIAGEVIVRGQPPSMPSAWDENILRIGQEALTNALRHAHASRVAIQISFTETGLFMRLRDDGQGFDPNRRHEGFGLLGIEERVREMGGQLSIESAIGAGTEISVALPIADNAVTGA